MRALVPRQKPETVEKDQTMFRKEAQANTRLNVSTSVEAGAIIKNRWEAIPGRATTGSAKVHRGLKIRSSVKAGGLRTHNRCECMHVRTGVRSGGLRSFNRCERLQVRTG